MSAVFVKLPDSDPIRPLPFYLAMEEWIARKAPTGDYFFMWQVKPTVIFGRNQQIEKEVNIPYCTLHGIEFYRRKSGGGCVFADMDNIMFSYITPADEVQTTFREYTGLVAAMLRSLGLNAEAGGRNDVLIDGRKVSGNAFYHIPGRSIVHGTMLYSTDMSHMLNAITPSRSKLESKQVKSVASHITTISEHLPDLNIEDFKKYTADYITDRVWNLTTEDIREIEELARPYFSPLWIAGHSKGSFTGELTRIEGAGEFAVLMTTDSDGKISELNLLGDYFPIQDTDSMLLEKLKGVLPIREELTKALMGIKVNEIISGLSNEHLIELITKVKGEDNGE